MAVVFAYTTGDNIMERPDGIIIASIFIFVTMIVSAISRYIRATELRVSGAQLRPTTKVSPLWKSNYGQESGSDSDAHSTAVARAAKLKEVRRIIRQRARRRL